VRDESSLLPLINQAIDSNKEIVEKYKKGKKGVIGVLIGDVMKKTRGRANPEVVRRLLLEKLESG